MADIAFLLLIFFLVTTTISADKGILRTLPAECPPNQICENTVEEQNLFRLLINANSELLVNDESTDLKGLKTKLKAFIDNNGSDNCFYCNGEKRSIASDHPKKATISFQYSPETSYESYINVQDIISDVFYELREAYSENFLNKAVKDLTKAELQIVKKAYPFNLHEVKGNQ